MVSQKETVPRKSHFRQPFVDGVLVKMTKSTAYQLQLHSTLNTTLITQLNRVIIRLDSTQFIAYVRALVLTRSVQVENIKCDEMVRGQV